MNMLVLTRDEGESITIGNGSDAIRVSIIRVRNGRVRLGVIGPRSVPVFRTELIQTAVDGPPRPEAGNDADQREGGF